MSSIVFKELRKEWPFKRIARRLEFNLLKQINANQSPAKTLREMKMSEQELTPDQIQLLANWRFNLPPS